MLNFSKGANYVISYPVWEEVFLKFPTPFGGRFHWVLWMTALSAAQWGQLVAAGECQRLIVEEW